MQSTEHPVVYLHREAEDWKAYNESAWYLECQYPEYAPDRDTTLDGLAFLYIRLTDTDLNRILPHQSFAKIETNLIAIDSPVAFQEIPYQNWLEEKLKA